MAVRSFLHYALEVPDQTVGQKYYQDFGLVDATGNGPAVRLKPARLAANTFCSWAALPCINGSSTKRTRTIIGGRTSSTPHACAPNRCVPSSGLTP